MGYCTMWRLNILLNASSNKPYCWVLTKLNSTKKRKVRDKVRLPKGRLIKRAWERNKRTMLLTQMAGLRGAELGNSNMSSFFLVLSPQVNIEIGVKCVALYPQRAQRCRSSRTAECAQTEWSISPFQSASISQQTQSQLKETAVGPFLRWALYM